ncbi:right-handed parallel beta-helix repeat-containing protein [Aeoliella sp. ICT_H6.2]|uniref:Right-handed parallel beta-helix repeat-containing protein n=1 Tax=Aeoliella straminimaris TaxID=2954799 RepID=A0A9X2FHJ4_9BACT|nr:right-handed parallel beta-helix repeat-containing protein [Aeoliella straminimaris]MCO6046954.1 right-handed parallel beta-helix repeat-containing protein [Aeoliella straminimaris]
MRLLADRILCILCAVCFVFSASRSGANDVQKETCPDQLPSGVSFDLQAFIDESISAGNSTVVVPPGRYRVEPTNGVHLRLHDLENVEIIAYDVEMVCTQTTRAVQIEGCRGLRLRGLSIDYDPLPFTQGRIVKLSADKSVHEIEILEGYPPADTAYDFKYQIFRGKDHELRGVDYYDLDVKAVSGTRLQVRKTNLGPAPFEQEGDLVAIGSRSTRGRQLSHAVYLTESVDILLEKVSVFASNCFAFLEIGCQGVTYDRCRVEKRDADDDPWPRGLPRLRSANADAFHSKRASAGPRIVGCYAHDMGDDCVNICGDYHLITSATDTKLRVLAKHGMDIVEGDLVELAMFSGGSLPDARVVSVRELGLLTPADRLLVQSFDLHQSLKDHEDGHLTKVFELTLDRAVTMAKGSLVSARERQGQGFLVAGCDFGHVRSRGILVKASNGEIRDNTLTRCRMESIKVAPEYYWLEAGAAENVKILRNKISNCGGVGIAVYTLGGDGEFGSGRSHRGISITDNRIDSCPSPNILVTSTSDLVITGNRCHQEGHVSSSGDALIRLINGINRPENPILTHHCTEVTMQGNRTR